MFACIRSNTEGPIVRRWRPRATIPISTQFLGIRLPVTFDTCEVIEESWANRMRQDPVVAIETQADNLRRLKAL